MGDLAVVTGASGGIGAAVARLIHEKSGGELRLVLQYNRDGASVESLRRELPGSVAVQADLSSREGRAKLVREALGQGSPYVLVNSAGTDRPHEPALAIQEESFDALIGLDLKAPLFLMQAFGAEMARAGSGVIVNVSSVLARRSLVGSAVYRAAKAGLEALTLQFAHELGPRGVRVNAVSPGFIVTKMTEGMTEAAKAETRKQIPLGEYGTPEAVAQAVGQLIDNDYINGAIVAVDGGLAA